MESVRERERERRWSVRGIRGAITADENSREAILDATRELVGHMLSENHLEPDQIASLIFTSTPDLTAAFPAEGARSLGLTQVPLLSSTEVPVPGGSPQYCIRALAHVNTDIPMEAIRHVYLRDAKVLRPDLASHSTNPTYASPSQPPGPPLREAVRSIEPYVPGKPIEEVQHELGISEPVKLASNENPLGPSPRAIEALKEWAPRAHRYPDGKCARLRAALATQLDLSADHFLFGCGSDEVIRMLGEAFLNAGDEVIYGDPSFSQYAFVTRLMGAKEDVVPLKEHRFDVAAIANRVTSRTRLVFLCNPNNPTGTYVSQSDVDRLLSRLPETALLVLDEAYAEYVSAPDYPDSVDLVRQGRPVVSLRTFSKAYGLAGLRIGYALAPAHIAAALERIRSPFNVNAAAQEAAIAALADQEHLARTVSLNASERQRLFDKLTGLGLATTPSETNFLFVETPLDSRRLFDALLRQGVIVRTGDVFGYRNHIRVSVGTEQENDRLIQALKAVLISQTNSSIGG